jgi:outer membrane protein assembly factor BamB
MSVIRPLAVLVVLLFAACSAVKDPVATASAADQAAFWPRFNGPDGTNISKATGLLKKWPADGPRLVWTAQGIGEGFAGATIANGLILTAGDLEGKTVVTALDMEGKTLWQRPNGPAWSGQHGGDRGTPTIDGDRVYHEAPTGELICLNAKTGEKIWQTNILERFEGKNTTWGLAESVLIDGPRLICCPGGEKGSVVALDKQTGKTVWAAKSTGDRAGYASPALVEWQGMRIILTMTAKALIGVSADTGDLLFRHEHITRYDVNALMPLYHDGKVFISSGYGSGSELVNLKVEGGKVSAEPVWQSKELDNHHGGVVLIDGYVYGAASDANHSQWICLEWKTGKKTCAAKGVGKGSLTAADGLLYTMSEGGKVGLVEATPQEFKLISQFKLPSGGEGPSWAHPVVCGGRLYIRHSNRLFAYDVRAGE